MTMTRWQLKSSLVRKCLLRELYSSSIVKEMTTQVLYCLVTLGHTFKQVCLWQHFVVPCPAH